MSEVYEAVAAFISKLGFPIFVATFLLLRVDKTLREILVLLMELTTAMKVLARLEEDEDDEESETDEGAPADDEAEGEEE